jgi:outer membrane protein assembly factor BamD (BamD/ComL family)
MRKILISSVFAAVVVLIGSSSLAAQRNIELTNDPVLEADAKHNLDVASQYFRLKKAYKSVLGRFEETMAAYPQFSKMDEFLYLAGMSSVYLSRNEGKQKVNLKSEKEKDKYDPEKLKEDAVAYLSLIVDKYPESKYREEAEKTLKEIGPGS